MLQPNNILPDNSTLLTHFIGRDSLRPQTPVDRLRIYPEVFGKLRHREVVFRGLTIPFLPEVVDWEILAMMKDFV